MAATGTSDFKQKTCTATQDTHELKLQFELTRVRNLVVQLYKFRRLNANFLIDKPAMEEKEVKPLLTLSMRNPTRYRTDGPGFPSEHQISTLLFNSIPIIEKPKKKLGLALIEHTQGTTFESELRSDELTPAPMVNLRAMLGCQSA